MMKRSIGFLILGVLLSFGLIHAQQPSHLNCTTWTGISSAVRTFYVSGFLDGVGAMAATLTASEERRRELIYSVWAAGLNVGQMTALIDEFCERPGNKDLPIVGSVMSISREIKQRSK
jgi:hypothetical protein